MRGRVLGMRQVLKTAPSALFGCGDVVKDRRAIRWECVCDFMRVRSDTGAGQQVDPRIHALSSGLFPK